MESTYQRTDCLEAKRQWIRYPSSRPPTRKQSLGWAGTGPTKPRVDGPQPRRAVDAACESVMPVLKMAAGIQPSCESCLKLVGTAPVHTD